MLLFTRGNSYSCFFFFLFFFFSFFHLTGAYACKKGASSQVLGKFERI
jgi:hypothetical protein